MKTYHCPACSTPNVTQLEFPTLLICRKCNHPVFAHIPLSATLKPSPVPRDWSFIQIGTKATVDNIKLEVVGRIRLQLRNDYKNFWCTTTTTPALNCQWIMESFGSIAIMDSLWNTFQGKKLKLKAGSKYNQSEGSIDLYCEYVEKCQHVSYEGELGKWTQLEAGFFFIQAGSQMGKETAIFSVQGKEIQYLIGNRFEIEKLKLENILSWDEWK